MTQVGWAIRFVEDDNTMEHLNVLRKNKWVLWGQWKRANATGHFSEATKQAMNECDDCHIYAIGSSTVWDMHVVKVMTAEEIKAKHLEYLIPEYYNVDTDCYCWYLIDNIQTYSDKTILADMYRASGAPLLKNLAQIAGNKPWRIYK